MNAELAAIAQPVRVRSNRNWIVGLIFLAVMLNYVDRQVIALLKPTLQADLGWSELDYGKMVVVFQIATAIGSLAGGWFIDRTGLKRGFASAVGGWSLATAAHVFVTTVSGFIGARFALGLAEAVGTPAVIKTAATYFEPAQRTRALGISNMAPSLGAVLAPLAIPIIAISFGWRVTFLGLGGLGLVWVAAWLLAPISGIRQGAQIDERPAARLAELFADRRTWALVLAKSLADLVWWFSIFFMPDLFHRLFHISQGALGLPVAMVYAAAAMGAFGSGQLHQRLMLAGVAPAKARKGAMAFFALVLLSIPLVLVISNPWAATALLALALFSYQGLSTNIFGLATDLFPASRVGSAIGLAAFSGNLAGTGLSAISAWCLHVGLGYAPVLTIVAAAPLAAMGVLQWLLPNFDFDALVDPQRIAS